MSLFSRTPEDVDGIPGALRDCTPGSKGRRKLRAGDIAVVDAPDLSRREAQFLIDSRPGAVVNAARFTTGSTPNYGPLMLIDSEIPLFEDAGAELRANFKDGTKNGLVAHNGALFVGDKQVASATPLNRGRAEQNFADAQRNLIDHMEAYFGNTIQFIHSEGPLLIDGLGIPDVGEELAGQKVLVFAPGEDASLRLNRLRHFIREYEPVIIGVGEASDVLHKAGYKPDLIVGDPADVDSETLRGGARVILPADPDGHALGLERIQDLGVGAMTFPAAIEDPADLALLLAGHHGADLVVASGVPMNLDDVFGGRPHANPGALLTRMKLGPRLVDAQAVDNLYTVNSGGSLAWLWAILAILVAVATTVAVVGFGGDGEFGDNLVHTWNNIALWFQGLFK